MRYIRLTIVAVILACLAFTITQIVTVADSAKTLNHNKQRPTDPENVTSAQKLPLISSSPNAVSNQLKNTEVGYSLFYPGDWQLRGQVTASRFANSAQCEAVEVVDFQPPPDAGPSALILHSFVQICAKPLTDKLTLDEFMQRTYGNMLADLFQVTKFAGMPAYRGKNEDQSTIIFLQTKVHRIQIVASVTADSDQRSQRLFQVREILESFSIT
jgi:hypothetical protein